MEKQENGAMTYTLASVGQNLMCKYLHTEITSWMCSIQKVLISNISLLYVCLIGSNVSFPFPSTCTQFGKKPCLRLRSIPKQLC